MADKNWRSARLDYATLFGFVLAFGGILGGLVLEGGKIRDIAQITAAAIVFGGTLGAVMVTTPLDVLMGAARKFLLVFRDAALNPDVLIDELIVFASKARKHGIGSLELDAEKIQDRFLSKALGLAVDGTGVQEIRKMMEIEITLEEYRWEVESKVYESAGGYSPTVGIIGAVLGLIQVMKHLENIDEVGHGIAVAFVATVYGVAAANLVFLPVASKIKARGAKVVQMRELMLEGVIAIAEGLNPKLIRTKLDAYLQGHATERERPRTRAESVRAAMAEA